VAVHLGLVEEAQRLYSGCQRYDLLGVLCRASGQWDRALDVAEKHDRIHLRPTHYAYAQHMEQVRLPTASRCSSPPLVVPPGCYCTACWGASGLFLLKAVLLSRWRQWGPCPVHTAPAEGCGVEVLTTCKQFLRRQLLAIQLEGVQARRGSNLHASR
jgi:hypothetical protein